MVSNDDGIDAPGLEALVKSLRGIGEIWVAAPDEPHSFCGHRITVHAPIEVVPEDTGRFRVFGTPADCARIALKALVPDADWFFSGINPGANLGSDVYNSGTVAAAREAAMLGCKAAAVSQYIARGRTIDWSITGRHTARVIRRLLAEGCADGGFWNVNLPHPLGPEDLPELRFCRRDRLPHDFSFRRQGCSYRYEGDIHTRPRTPGRDVAVCFEGAVAISSLAV